MQRMTGAINLNPSLLQDKLKVNANVKFMSTKIILVMMVLLVQLYQWIPTQTNL